jgi:MoaA/NifB/PqqE/SkfB family radical SAM enzyme
MSEMRPAKIRLEASSVCQLRCPSCPTTSKAIHPAVGSGFLKLRDFQQLLNENPWLKVIELSNYGEIFLNPELLDILKYSYERNVALRADTGVNLNNVKEGVLEGLVKYKFRSMTCSIDGASNETYTVYRVKGNFHAVIENIQRINRFKQQYASKYPRLKWQFVAFGHNEHEIPLARQLAHELGMKFHVKLSWDPRFSPIRDQELLRKEIGAASREEYKRQHGVDYMQAICYQLWDQPQINWDGKVLGCCRNFWGDFGGNAFRDGLFRSLNGEKMHYARAMLLGKKAARQDIPCTTCDIYLGMRQDGKWLRRPSLPYRALRRIYYSLLSCRKSRWLPSTSLASSSGPPGA